MPLDVYIYNLEQEFCVFWDQ
jgi:hypothetical protein